MRLTRTELKQIAGFLWINSREYIGQNRDLLQKAQNALNQVGPRLRDSIEVELTAEDVETVDNIKNKLGIK